MQNGNWYILIAALLALFGFIFFWTNEQVGMSGLFLVATFALLALFLQFHPRLNIIAFPVWVFTMITWALYYPSYFLSWGPFSLNEWITPLIQLIMLGMGATLSLADFVRALRMPQAVLIGLVLQFSVMPVLGWAIAKSFDFPVEIAAGIILIGSCSGGVSSNVMAFLAKGNVALSVTMTSCSTLMAPLMTPFAMKLLAGRLIEIDLLAMMLSIVQLVILPVGAGLLLNRLFTRYQLSVNRILPGISMAGICFILAIIAADSRDNLLKSGLAVIGAALIHNITGYLLGYLAAGWCRLPETDRRTVAFEVGMQNGGMAVGLAIDVLKSPLAALAGGIFGTFMNVTGSALASWWRDRPPDES